MTTGYPRTISRRPPSRGGAPHVADQYRHGAALDPRRPRPRLYRTERLAEKIERTLATVEGLERYEDTFSTGTTPRPSHIDSPIRLHRGQRKPRRRPPDSRGRATRVGGDRKSDESSLQRLECLASRALALAEGMNFEFLYDQERQIFSIGYRLADADGPGRLDPSFYDLLASEARLASFVAIAKGDVPDSHWFHLGRLLTSVDGAATLLSWSATLFEYLMPLLVVRSYPGTLLDQSCRMAVRRHIEYGNELGVPWGISESAFNVVDRHGNYQYKAFGVPGLGLKRGLGDELVVAPYATALAAMVDPEQAAQELPSPRARRAGGRVRILRVDRLHARAEAGAYGEPHRGVVVQSFLAHHQGMTLVALANTVMGDPMVQRLHADTRVQATALLLQERAPRHAPITQPRPAEETRVTAPATPAAVRRFRSPHTRYPHAAFLSNGTYTAVVTNAGGGASLCRGRAVTRYREDATRDQGSQFLYLRDVRTGSVWSADLPSDGSRGRRLSRHLPGR